jgi:hypothetical protein
MEENEEEGKITVYREKAKLPLFHIGYEIIIAEDPEIAKELIEDLWLGIEIPFTEFTLSYSCGITGLGLAENILIFIKAGKPLDVNQSIESIIAHEANNLAWLITKELSIPVEFGNHIIHSYITSDVVRMVTRTLRDFEEKTNDIDSL